mmetsp:Transcript_10780/g.28847  ORF Transcript_10780/g.28847 Transcript_10780/m.28847 type:complete len:278 (-) Transcript_10780:1562-2395(-)
MMLERRCARGTRWTHTQGCRGWDGSEPRYRNAQLSALHGPAGARQCWSKKGSTVTVNVGLGTKRSYLVTRAVSISKVCHRQMRPSSTSADTRYMSSLEFGLHLKPSTELKSELSTTVASDSAAMPLSPSSARRASRIMFRSTINSWRPSIFVTSSASSSPSGLTSNVLSAPAHAHNSTLSHASPSAPTSVTISTSSFIPSSSSSSSSFSLSSSFPPAAKAAPRALRSTYSAPRRPSPNSTHCGARNEPPLFPQSSAIRKAAALRRLLRAGQSSPATS